jgi:hypothetical protein
MNPLSESVVDLKVIAVGYNANGKIVGGGYTYTDEIPASGALDVEVSVIVSEDPVRVEMYPVFTSITEIGDS